jgi:succinyl-CoA synthetase beta subunit
MRLHEHEAADLFEMEGIPVPKRGLAESTEKALQVAGEIGYPVMVKAQVLAGGRGLAGGVQSVATPEALEDCAGCLLGSDIKGLPVRKLLICEQAEVLQELYVGVTVDGYHGKPVIVASKQGGVRIEEVARRTPQNIAKLALEPGADLYPYQARNLLAGLGVSRQLLITCADVAVKLYRVFMRTEALIAEINPLAVLSNERVLAVDAVLELDNAVLPKLNYSTASRLERMENDLERKGRQIGVTYVDLDGDIGLISSGAGLGMASMDIVGKRMRPANFLETGGGITAELLYKSMALIMMKKGLRAVFINLYGGINPIHEGAKGVVRYIKDHKVRLPIVAKALGNRQEETWEILRAAGVHVVTEAATEKAVDKLFDILDARSRPMNPSINR